MRQPHNRGVLFLASITGFILALIWVGVVAAGPKPQPRPGLSAPAPALASFTVGGTVSGLNGSGLVLVNNGIDNLPVGTNGGFTFATPLHGGLPYSVTVKTQPAGGTCAARNGNGTIGTGTITDVSVVCAPDRGTPAPAPTPSAAPASPAAPAPTAAAAPDRSPSVGNDGVLKGSIDLTDKTWTCDGPVDLTSVTVTLTPQASSMFGIMLRKGCTGSIGTINVTTARGDGVHIGNPHDVTIGGGTITCDGHALGTHQDGIQAMGGVNVTFTHVTVKCFTGNNSGFFVNDGAQGHDPPTNVVFDRGTIIYGGTSSAFVGDHQTGSGVTNSVICKSKYFAYRNGDSPNVINKNNTFPAKC